MKKEIEELKNQLEILKEKIGALELVIDESKKENIIIEKVDFSLLKIKVDNSYVIFTFKGCVFQTKENSEEIKLFNEGKLDFIVIKKREKVEPWLSGRYLLTHILLPKIEAAQYKHYGQ